MKEVWTDVKHYDGLYKVSNYGRVWSCSNNKYLAIHTKSNGYQFVQLYKNGKMRNEYLHRLVALAFIPNPNNLPIIKHKDENPSNNIVSNLEWCTVSYNNNYNKRNEKIGDEEGHDISVYDKDNKYIESFPSITKAANAYGISLTTLWRRVQDGQIINDHYFKEEL